MLETVWVVTTPFHGSRNIKPELVFRIHATLRAHEVNRFEFTKGAKQMRLMSWCNVEMQHKAGGFAAEMIEVQQVCILTNRI